MSFSKISAWSTRELADGSQVAHSGVEFGCVHPKHPEFQDKINFVRESLGLDIVIAQKLGFNNQVSIINSLALVENQFEGFYRTNQPSDGVLINKLLLPKTGIMVMNADCPIVKMSAGNCIEVLHCGLNNIDAVDGPSIVESGIYTLLDLGFDPEDITVDIGEAALKCCYGFEKDNNPHHEKNLSRARKLINRYGVDVIDKIEKGPRAGGLGFDMALIAARQAEYLGVNRIAMSDNCTSCMGTNTDQLSVGSFYSNIRADRDAERTQGFGERNMTLVYWS